MDTPDGYEYETVHADQEKTNGGEQSDYGGESELEPVDEGAVLALSVEDIRKMRQFVKPPDHENLELNEGVSRLEQESFCLVDSQDLVLEKPKVITPTHLKQHSFKDDELDRSNSMDRDTGDVGSTKDLCENLDDSSLDRSPKLLGEIDSQQIEMAQQQM